MLYKIKYSETYSNTYMINADSYEEACNEILHNLETGVDEAPDEMDHYEFAQLEKTPEDIHTILDIWKDRTAFFDGSISYREMYEMLRYRMAFGEAETHVIISALEIAGAKFKEEGE